MMPPRYHVVDLGTLGGSDSADYAINNHGQVVGAADTIGRDPWSEPIKHAFLWQQGVATDLDTLAPRETRDWYTTSRDITSIEEYVDEGSHANGINDQGQIVGEATNAEGVRRPCLWAEGAAKDLGTLGGDHGCATGVNENGDIVGEADTTDSTTHAFLLRHGKLTDLGTLGGTTSHARAVNRSLQVVGLSFTEQNRENLGFKWQSDEMKSLDVGAGLVPNMANSINRNGEIVGVAQSMRGDRLPYKGTDGIPYVGRKGFSRAFYYSDAQGVVNLGTLPGGDISHARKINDLGQIVGSSGTSKHRPNHAFLFSDGVMQDLNDLIAADCGWELISAEDINDSGWIVGWGYGPHQGPRHGRAFLLIPLSG